MHSATNPYQGRRPSQKSKNHTSDRLTHHPILCSRMTLVCCYSPSTSLTLSEFQPPTQSLAWHAQGTLHHEISSLGLVPLGGVFASIDQGINYSLAPAPRPSGNSCPNMLFATTLGLRCMVRDECYLVMKRRLARLSHPGATASSSHCH